MSFSGVAVSYSQTVGAQSGEIFYPIVHFAMAKTLENHKTIHNEKPIATYLEAKIGSNFSRLRAAREQLPQACLP
jgi:hypothetical protein